jgi:hypothetical protein
MNFKIPQSVKYYLDNYEDEIMEQSMRLRKIVLNHLPGIQEEVDLAAGMIAYTYGKKYQDMICTIIPSKKGIKLGFYKGNELPDPDRILSGKGKISRYVQIHRGTRIPEDAISGLIKSAKAAYDLRSSS